MEFLFSICRKPEHQCIDESEVEVVDMQNAKSTLAYSDYFFNNENT